VNGNEEAAFLWSNCHADVVRDRGRISHLTAEQAHGKIGYKSWLVIGPQRPVSGCNLRLRIYLFITPIYRTNRGGTKMQNDTLVLDQLQNAYKAAIEEWIAAIKQEEALASVNHSVAEVDKWEQAHFREDEIRSKVKAAKKQYEDALREKFFGF
jgi:hypothetical protein